MYLLEDIQSLLQLQEPLEENITDTTYRTEERMFNRQRFKVHIVGGEEYLSLGNVAQIWGRTAAGLSLRLNQMRDEEGLELRHRFRFDKRSTYIKVSDMKKYFFTEETEGKAKVQ